MADSHNLMVVLAHLQGAAATFRVGRHHHRGPLHEGRGLTHALTHTAPTDLTVAAALVRKAYSKRRRSCLWSKPVNLRTWRLVSDPIAMVQALAELRCGVVAYTRAKQCEIWAQFQPNPFSEKNLSVTVISSDSVVCRVWTSIVLHGYRKCEKAITGVREGVTVNKVVTT